MLTVTCRECHIQALYAECHYAECRYVECRGAGGAPYGTPLYGKAPYTYVVDKGENVYL
jgi:hypothetical protein